MSQLDYSKSFQSFPHIFNAIALFRTTHFLWVTKHIYSILVIWRIFKAYFSLFLLFFAKNISISFKSLPLVKKISLSIYFFVHEFVISACFIDLFHSLNSLNFMMSAIKYFKEARQIISPLSKKFRNFFLLWPLTHFPHVIENSFSAKFYLYLSLA